MQLHVINTTGKNTELSVSDAVFAGKVNKILMAQAVRVYQMNQRQGTSKVKTRGEINRTKKKWFKQKGTGNARHGARTPNIFVGGGVSHGPNGLQNWSRALPKTMKRKAMISALSARKDDMIVTTILDGLTGKTKDAAAFLNKLVPDTARILIVVDSTHENILKSTRNLPYVLLTTASRMNVYETLLADKIVMTKEAVKALEARLSDETEGEDVKVKAEKTEKVAAVEVVEKAEKPKKTVAKKAAAKVSTKEAKPAAKKVAKKKAE